MNRELELQKLTVPKLRAIAKELNVKGRTEFRKQALINEIIAYENGKKRPPMLKELKEEAKEKGLIVGNKDKGQLIQEIKRVNEEKLELGENVSVNMTGNKISKRFTFSGDLDQVIENQILEAVLPTITTRVRLKYGFSCIIRRGDGESYYGREFYSPLLSKVDEIRDWFIKYENLRFDFSNEEVWRGSYLPPEVVLGDISHLQGEVSFNLVEVKVMYSDDPLLKGGELEGKLINSNFIYSFNNFSDSLCFWRCLAVYSRIKRGMENPQKYVTDDALTMARCFFGNQKMSLEMVPGINIPEIERAADFFKVNVLLYEPRDFTIDNTKDYSWHLVGSYGKGDICRIGMQNGHCFYIKDIERLAKVWKCLKCDQEFRYIQNYNRHIKKPCSKESKVICNGENVKRQKSSSERAFNGTGWYSKEGCEWIEEESERLGVHIHHALCGHGGERKIPIKRDEDGNVTKSYKVDGFEPISYKVFEFNGCWAHGCPCNPKKL